MERTGKTHGLWGGPSPGIHPAQTVPIGRREMLKATGIGVMGLALSARSKAAWAQGFPLPFDVRGFVSDPDQGPRDRQCSFDRLNVTGNLFPDLRYADLLPMPVGNLIPLLNPGLQLLGEAGLVSNLARIGALLAELETGAGDSTLIDLFAADRNDPRVRDVFGVLLELSQLGLTLPLPAASPKDALARREAAMRLVGLDPNGTFQTLFTTPRSGVPRDVVRLLQQLKRHGLSLVASGGYNYRCCIGVNCFQTDRQLWCNTINTGAANQECSEVSDPC